MVFIWLLVLNWSDLLRSGFSPLFSMTREINIDDCNIDDCTVDLGERFKMLKANTAFTSGDASRHDKYVAQISNEIDSKLASGTQCHGYKWHRCE